MRFWAPVLAAPLLLVQARGRRQHRPGGPDAGVGIAIHVPRDGGTVDGGALATSDELESLRREVAALQARTAALEREASRSRGQEQVVQQLSGQLAALRQQLTQGQQQQVDAQQQEQGRRSDVQAAISGLQGVQSALAGGSLDVDAALAEAQESLPPQAQRDLAAARDAIRNRDVYNARAYVAQAIADAQQGR